MQMLASGFLASLGMTDLFSAPFPVPAVPVSRLPFVSRLPLLKHLHLHRHLPRMLVQLVNQVLETLTHRAHVVIEP